VLSSGVHATIAGVLLAMTIPARGPGAPLERIEHRLTGVVAFAIMPLFALANAGVSLSGGAIVSAIRSPVAIGVVAGLVLGKPLGITLLSWLSVRAGVARLPAEVRWPMLAGVSLLGGIGFTMALFIAGLAFRDPGMLDVAKVAILSASVVAGALGWMSLRGGAGRRS
jgi:NhaA family Na+:H+ antiporter